MNHVCFLSCIEFNQIWLFSVYTNNAISWFCTCERHTANCFYMFVFVGAVVVAVVVSFNCAFSSFHIVTLFLLHPKIIHKLFLWKIIGNFFFFWFLYMNETECCWWHQFILFIKCYCLLKQTVCLCRCSCFSYFESVKERKNSNAHNKFRFSWVSFECLIVLRRTLRNIIWRTAAILCFFFLFHSFREIHPKAIVFSEAVHCFATAAHANSTIVYKIFELNVWFQFAIFTVITDPNVGH